MIFPEKERFLELSKNFNRVTVYREIAGDIFTPISLLRNFSNEKYLFLLESANLDKTFSRYSFFGINPTKILRFKGGKLLMESGGKKNEVDMNPIDFLNHEISSFNGYADNLFGDFCGGYVGYFGYEMSNYFGFLREKLKEDSKSDLMALMLVEEFFVFDNHFGKMYAAKSVSTKGDPSKNYELALKRLNEMANIILSFNFDNFDSDSEVEIEKDFTKEEFVEKVKMIKRDIENGELIQCVLSNRYTLKGKINPVTLYRTLRNLNPSPYMFYLKFGNYVLTGSSPEIHLKVVGKKATLKPIAGTYAIGDDLEKIKKELLSDQKEVAEHLMLLDLARNDLYTGCDDVKVDKSFQAEVYSHVVHIVSEVSGVMRDGENALNLFMKTFPAGTVTGAPKVRAMELIDKYENSTRGFYAGCTGYISFNGNLDTCITIRSALVKQNETIFRAGAGIVYDSNPEKEYLEVERKLAALNAAIKRIKSLEVDNVFVN
ncbi:anthranilate synthase component I [Calditerrivibrio nitroreducens]|uniref:Anthranilate synthase component 1 n=1 Tax=Calditerrivibrio nitroreducens (strain DSM 19672 / NBRC 101217 / Yu37-1) TaxID=768670 RepID=E4THV8_CALNY|nr:anthranilate synthase component I [Calditerrivibrio nitroreducens]ADR18888.1 anthranilate synthase, component I [Calditerrivibrio nitroreducens DSM 19672]